MDINSWKDISLKKFIEVYTITKTIKDTIEQEIHLLACLKGVSYQEIEGYTVSRLTKESSQLSFMKELPSEKKLATKFRYKGEVYKACLLFSDMKASQFIDFSSVCKDVNPEDMINHAADLIGAMVQRRKIEMKYPFYSYEYIGYDKTDFSDMPMSQAYPYYVFFCNVLTNFYPDMVNSSIKTAKKQLKKAKRILKTS